MPAADPSLPTSPAVHVARAYQDELVDKAIREDIVVSLGTGMGKTYIAVKVIQALQHQIEDDWDAGGKRTVFAVPTEPLVKQQARYLEKWTGCPTGAYSSSAEETVAKWEAPEWHDQFRRKKILVMVHDVLKQLLIDAILPVDRINLLIVDECHHAAKNHPYREIMREVHQFAKSFPNSSKPRILGLTASVINIKLKTKDDDGSTTKAKLEKYMKELESCMGCKVDTSCDESMRDVGARPDPSTETYQEETPDDKLEELLEEIDELAEWLGEVKMKYPKELTESNMGNGFASLSLIKCRDALTDIKNAFAQVRNTLTSLGPFCAYESSQSLLKDLKYMIGREMFNHEILEHVKIVTARLHLIGSLMEIYYKLHEFKSGTSEKDLLALATPKIKCLLNLLRVCSSQPDQGSGDTANHVRCIVFIKERYNAWALQQFMQLLSEAPGGTYRYIRSGFCVGQLEDGGAEETIGDNVGLSAKQFDSTIEKFRSGDLNMLLSTDVVEEGFDVPECGLIIRFDPPSNYRSYVQSKGRARARNSKYIVMLSRSIEATVRDDLRQYQEVEELMKKHCLGRAAATEEEQDDHFASDEKYPPFQPPGCQAKITVNSALTSLQRYCNELPNDKMSFNLIVPVYGKMGYNQYSCKLYLPRNAAIKNPVVGAGENRTVAKKAAALQCCVILFQLGELDSVNLLPKSVATWQKDLDDFIGDPVRETAPKEQPQPGTARRVQIYPKSVPTMLASPVEADVPGCLYGIRLTLDGTIGSGMTQLLDIPEGITVGIFTGCRLPELPPFPLYNDLKQYRVHIQILERLQLSAVEFKALQVFHTTVFEHVLGFTRMLKPDDFSPESCNMLVVPLMPKLALWSIDWEQVKRLSVPGGFDVKRTSDKDRKGLMIKPDALWNGIVATWYRGEPDRYFVLDVRSDISPFTMFHKNGQSSADYMKAEYGVSIQQKNQPMLMLKHCSKGLNFLQPKPRETRLAAEERKRDKETAGIPVAAELCQLLPVSIPLYQSLRIVPSVIHRISWFGRMLDLSNFLRMGTGIGAEVPKPTEWQPLTYDETKYKDIYRDIQNLISPTDSEKSVTSSSSTSSRSEPTDEEAEKHGLFYEKWKATEFYIKLKKRQARVPNNLVGRLKQLNFVHPPASPRVSRQSATGCATRLLPPPFLLDGTYSVEPKQAEFPEITELLKAVTTPFAGDCFNMERLETMGDSFLKLSSCLYLYLKYGKYHEGKLSELKGRQVSNYNLYRLARSRDLPGFVQNQSFAPLENFLPPGFVGVVDSPQLVQKLRDKSLADIVEALIGLILLESGPLSAQKFMEWMGLKVTLAGFRIGSGQLLPSQMQKTPSTPSDLHELTAGYSDFEERIGYKFRQPELLLQAFTHSSFFSNRITDCYQRLEFLGDSILDFLVTRYLYEQKQRLTPGQMTDLRSALVNNKTFSALAVQFGFHQHIRYFSPKIFGLIKKYVSQQKETNPNIEPLPDDMFMDVDGDEDENGEAYQGLEIAEDPKTLGDIFESVAGAIFLDSGLSLDAVWRVYYNLMRERIEYCVEHCPKNPVRILLELEGPNCNFKAPEKLHNGKVRVAVEIFDRKTYYGIGNNHRIAKCTAAIDALKELKPDAKLF